jgi:hypothetical protein
MVDYSSYETAYYVSVSSIIFIAHKCARRISMAEPKGFLQSVPNQRSRAVTASRQTREILQVARTHYWAPRVLGVAPVPVAPVFHDNCWLVPLADDHSVIPSRALRRVQTIYEAGIRPKAFIVAHEAPPHLLAAKAAPKETPVGHRAEARPSEWAAIGGMVARVVGGVGLALLAVSLAGPALMLFGLIGMAALIDPALICVTEDDVWIVVDAWLA